MFNSGSIFSGREEVGGTTTRKDTMCVSPDGPPEIYKVGIKVPPFYPDDPEIWFAQLEGQFALANITSDMTKFYYVIGHIEHQYAKEIKDIIMNPPAAKKYDKLKSELVNRLSASKASKIKQLLRHEELGDRKPSQLCRHLRDLAGAEFPDEYLHTIWISPLPVNVQTVLAAQRSASLEEQAELADKIMDIATSTPNVHASVTPSPVDDDLRMVVSELRRQIEVLTSKSSKRCRLRARQPQRGRSRSRSQSGYRKYPMRKVFVLALLLVAISLCLAKKKKELEPQNEKEGDISEVNSKEKVKVKSEKKEKFKQEKKEKSKYEKKDKKKLKEDKNNNYVVTAPFWDSWYPIPSQIDPGFAPPPRYPMLHMYPPNRYNPSLR
ncbi:jg13749 [Pararge aegeria aegeria]|uniref:Jg13749 protein n=1 Tax=Pararge aegeria aegeria TaxID=348720 RepID=A0A8S4QPY9_9NEOP|nr:jg13749 [Pararge aegeria aegeria]